MTYRQYSDWSSDPAWTIHGSHLPIERIVWTDDDDDRVDRKKTSFAWYWCFRCCIVGSLLAGIGLAIVLTFWLTSKTTATQILTSTMSTSTTSTSTSATSTSTTSISTSTTSQTTTTTTSTTSTSTSTSTTTTLPICNTTCLNQTWLSTASILAKWHFENNYLDDTTIHNGVASGSPNLTFVQGYAGQAISFVANSNQMVSTSYIPLANTSFSIDAWIYPT
ncbi:unnamed protein product, partial [Adineta steineri]